MNLIYIEDKITLDIAVRKESLSFNQLVSRKLISKDDLLILIATFITIVCDVAFEVGRPLNSAKSILIANSIMNRHDLTVEDIVCLMKMAKNGELGKIYNKIDMETFAGWIDKYLDFRIDAHEQMLERGKNQFSIPAPRTSSILPLKDISKQLPFIQRNKRKYL